MNDEPLWHRLASKKHPFWASLYFFSFFLFFQTHRADLTPWQSPPTKKKVVSIQLCSSCPTLPGVTCVCKCSFAFWDKYSLGKLLQSVSHLFTGVPPPFFFQNKSFYGGNFSPQWAFVKTTTMQLCNSCTTTVKCYSEIAQICLIEERTVNVAIFLLKLWCVFYSELQTSTESWSEKEMSP